MAEHKEKKYNDLGLGAKASSGKIRALNKDGSFNVKKTKIPFFERIDFFHSLISMSWLRFFGIVFFCYIGANLVFSSAYVLIGVEHLTGTEGESALDKFIEAFFFSSQTITTLGYGRVAPIGVAANTIAAIESMLGLLVFAIATSLLYGRFSKPTAKIKYSNQALIAPYQNGNAFMFRVINIRNSQLLEVEVVVTLSIQKINSELRDFHLLELERKNVVFFPSVWTVVHPITENSPLYALSKHDFLERDVEFIIMIKAFDQSFSQTVYSRSSYKAFEIMWGEKFVYMLSQDNETIVVDVSRIDETEKVELN